MIAVVMGQQDGIEHQIQRSQPLQHGFGLARIDDQAVIFVSDQPDVVVAEGGTVMTVYMGRVLCSL
jgi:hypothetical protein